MARPGRNVDPPPTRADLGQCPDGIDEADIRDLFKDCGTISDIRWITDRETGNFKGCGFVEFEDTESTDKAVAMNGAEVKGRNLRIDFSQSRGRQDRSASRGSGGDRPLTPKPDGCTAVFLGQCPDNIDRALNTRRNSI